MISKKFRIRAGIILISLSVLLFLILFALPFLKLKLNVKLTLTTILIVAGEVFFWTGTLILGKEVWQKYKNYLKSGAWLKDKKDQ